jgi:hypothetical protein
MTEGAVASKELLAVSKLLGSNGRPQGIVGSAFGAAAAARLLRSLRRSGRVLRVARSSIESDRAGKESHCNEPGLFPRVHHSFLIV